MCREAITNLSPRTLNCRFARRRVKKALASVRYSGSVPTVRLRHKKTATETMVKSLEPRMDEEKRYSHTKDKGKERQAAVRDRLKREFKRNKKAAKRELQRDGQAIERARRNEAGARSEGAKRKRHENFAWLEGEQATVNQQVRSGGGLMKGGGTGAADRARKRGKLGIKKGGK